MSAVETSHSEFLSFALTCEAIRSTRSKLQKVSILSNYLTLLQSDADLTIAITFLAGRILSPGSERELNVGYSLLWATISELTGLPNSKLSDYYLKYGDLGDVFQSAAKLEPKPHFFGGLDENALTLEEVFQSFQEISRTTGRQAVKRKKLVLLRLFSSVKKPVEGKYLIKILTGEMRIGLVEGLVEESIAKRYSKTLEEIRKANLLIANPGKVAVLARANQLAKARLEPLQPTNFMLASSAADANELFSKFKAMPVFAEFKYDGIRAQIHKSGNRVRIFSRNLADITPFFPELERPLMNQSEEALILDGEIVAFRNGKPLPFQLLQRRLRKLSRSEKEAPVRYFAFDVLHNGSSQVETRFEERLPILRSIRLPEIFSFSDHKSVSSAEEIKLMFEESKSLGYEGLVVKDPGSNYAPGKRGNSWVKLKKELDTLDVVIVAAEYGHGKRAGVISDYTFAVRDGESFKVVGKAYSGLTDKEIGEMTSHLKSITVKDYGYRRTVKPEVVIEVAFDAIQRSDRHDSGFALRFPRIKRIRTDKSASEIDTLDRMKQIHESQIIRADSEV